MIVDAYASYDMTMKILLFILLSALLVIFPAVPAFGQAQSQTPSFEISGWIPYWRSEKSVANILPNLGAFTEVNPFTIRANSDGELREPIALFSPEWLELRKGAKERNVRFIPTILWGDGDAIDEVLRDPQKRADHVRAVAAEIFKYDLDGIDIDYEGKYARTRFYFSEFLKDLRTAVGYDKWIMCTIESRTPLESRYESPESVPPDIEYANDFPEINKYCDRVRIMAYDQERIDFKLNAENPDPYAAVADKHWVEKVMRLVSKDIDKDKLVIGVPTYGYEYDMFPATTTVGAVKMQYSRLWSFNPGYAMEVMQKLSITPTRTAGGELMLAYPASQSIDPSIPLPNATRVMVWSDAEAIRDKAKLAQALGLRGIAVFKIDGGQDPGVFGVLAAYKSGENAAKKPLDVTAGSGIAVALPVPSRNLSLGARHEDVRALQKLLNAKGYLVAGTGAGSPGKETIYFGPATRNAVIKFQRAKNIRPAAGFYGPLTRAAIARL